MGFFLFLVWYMIAILPLLIFDEGSDKLSEFLKKRNIYTHWDIWHSLLLVLIILLLIFYSAGYR